jgi:streptogramin lyase
MKSKPYALLYAAIVLGAAPLVAQPAQLQSVEPSPLLMKEHQLAARPLNLVAEAAGRVWFTLPDANAIGSLVVSDTVTITTHLAPTTGSEPYDLVYVDGAIWFTARAGNQIGRFDPQTAAFQVFAVPTANSEPTGIAVAPDGAVWFTQRAGNKIARFDPSTSRFAEYNYDVLDAQFEDIAILDNNTVWATAPNLNQLVRLIVSGAAYSFYGQNTVPYTRPVGIVAAGDQQLWVTANQSNLLLRFTPYAQTQWQPYELPTANGGPAMLVHQDLGDIWEFWFTQRQSGRVGQLRVQPDGTLVSLRDRSLPAGAGQPWGVAADARGHVWVAAGEGKQISQWQPPYFEPLHGPSEALLPLIVRDRCSRAKPPTLFGVQMYGPTGATSPHHTFLTESGAHWVRNELSWSDVEPVNSEPDQFDWRHADAVAGAAREGCFNMILTILNNPTWAAAFPAGPINRVGLDEFVEFVIALIERYDGDGQADAPGAPVVNYFEFYNEPDASPFSWGNEGDAYAAMLAAVYPAVKEANPQAQVVFGGIAHDGFVEHGGSFIRAFLGEVLAAGGGAHFDYMNFHYYPAFAGNWTQGNGPGLLEKVAAVRQQLNVYGIDKPILITETGWPNSDQTGAADANDIRRFILKLAMRNNWNLQNHRLISWCFLLCSALSWPRQWRKT